MAKVSLVSHNSIFLIRMVASLCRILNFTDDIASLLSHLDVFPDEIGEDLEGVARLERRSQNSSPWLQM